MTPKADPRPGGSGQGFGPSQFVGRLKRVHCVPVSAGKAYAGLSLADLRKGKYDVLAVIPLSSVRTIAARLMTDTDSVDVACGTAGGGGGG